jgi:hypothetical protein
MKRILMTGLCYLLLADVTTTLAAQTVSSGLPVLRDWAKVQQLAAGQELRVERQNKQKVWGFLVAVSDTELQLEKEGVVMVLKQAEIKKVWHVTGSNRTRQRLYRGIGIGAGLFAGLFIGVALGFQPCGGSCNEEKVGIAAAMIGLPLAGGLLGHKLSGSGKRTLIYSAP